MTLLQSLQSEITSSLLDDGSEEWKTFVIDHIDYLRALGTRVIPDPSYMVKYRYDVESYLADNGMSALYSWIFLLINDMSSSFEFYKSQEYVIVSDSVIQNLYQKYRSTSVDMG